jgi:prolycopene isomerase
MGISSDNSYDMIVIGSGLGGLSCALHLAKQGFHVLVLEKQPRLGGYCQNYSRDGYYFDVSQHVLAGLSEGQGFYRLLDHLQVIDKLEIESRDPMFASIFPDRSYLLPAGAGPLADYLKSEFPNQRAGIDAYFHTIRQMVEENFELFWTGDIDVETYFPARYFQKTYQELLSEHFDDPRLQGILGQLWQSTGLPNRLCAANWSVEVCGMHWLTGNYHIVGGGQALSSAMAQTLRDAGGVVQLGSLVEKILLKDRVTQGVELENGERYFAPIVVSNANPIQTYFKLVGRENISKPYAYKLGTMEPSCSLLTLYLGLDRPASSLGLDHHSVFVNHRDDNHVSYQLAMAEDYDHTDYMVSDYSEENGRSHPRGHGIAQMLEVAPGEPWTSIDKERYDDKKELVKEILLAKLARRYPELVAHIDICELGTPRTMLRVTRNPFGAVYGWAQTPGQADIYRFGSKSLFEGLYFTGAWCRGGGGGYMGTVINGRVTSREIMQREQLPGREVHFPEYRRKPESPRELAKSIYTVTLDSNDLTLLKVVRPDAVVRIATDSANRYISEWRGVLARDWPSIAGGGEVAFTFFNLKLLIVPGATAAPNDAVRIEVELTPTGDGRGELCIVLSLADSGSPLLKAQGRGLAGLL